MYRDISSYYKVVENATLLCEDGDAIFNGFLNLVNTNIDPDGVSERPFRPNLGTTLLALLEDPLDNITSFQIKLTLEHIGEQMTRAKVSSSLTTVTPVFDDDGGGCFEVYIVLIDNITGDPVTGTFTLTSAS